MSVYLFNCKIIGFGYEGFFFLKKFSVLMNEVNFMASLVKMTTIQMKITWVWNNDPW